MYEQFVGEIGIPRNEFLYELKFWELRAIMRGYQRRFHPIWDAARFMGYCSLKPWSKDIRNPSDLVQFTWEKEKDDLPDDEWVEQERKRLQALNEANAKKSTKE